VTRANASASGGRERDAAKGDKPTPPEAHGGRGNAGGRRGRGALQDPGDQCSDGINRPTGATARLPRTADGGPVTQSRGTCRREY